MGYVTLQKYSLYIIKELNKRELETSLPVQWLRFHLPMQGVQAQSLVEELRPHIPRCQKAKTQNRSIVVTNSINTLKMVHIKTKSVRKERKCLYVINRLPKTDPPMPHRILCIFPISSHIYYWLGLILRFLFCLASPPRHLSS